MAAIEQIRRVVTQYESSGAEKAAADFNAVAAAETNAARAGEQVATVTDIVSKKQISAAAAYDRLRRTIDEEYRAQQQLAKGQATLDTALRQGVISAEEYTRALAMLEARTLGVSKTATVPMTGIASTSKLASHEVTNLTAQLQDIGVSLAGGMSPFTVMMQQGSQISAMMGDRGLKTIISGVGTALLSLINPTTAVLAGFTALYVGGTYAYEALIGSSKSLDDTIKTQERLLKELSKAYDQTSQAATKWKNASKPANIVETSAALDNAKKQLEDLSKAYLTGGLFGGGVGRSTRGGFQIADEFKAFSAAIREFQQSARGFDDVNKFIDAVGAIGASDASLTKVASKLIEAARSSDDADSSMTQAASAVQKLEAQLAVLLGTATPAQKALLGLSDAAKELADADKMIARIQQNIALIGNDRERHVRDAVAGLGPTVPQEKRDEVSRVARQEYDAEKASREAEKAAREAQSEAKRASDDLAREGKRVWEDTRTAAEDYAAEIAKLNDLLAKGAITQDTYARATAKAAEEMEKARTEEYRKGLEKSSNPYDGVTLAAMDYQKNIGSMAKQTADATTSMISSMEDAYVDFVKTGKVNFSDLVDSMIADLARFAFQQAALGLMGMLGIGGSTGSSLGTVGSTTGAVYVAGSHTGGVPGVGEATFYRRDDPALYLNAQRFHTGRDPFALMAGERRAIIKNDEGVFTAGQMRALGARMGGGDTIAPVFSPILTINGGGGQSVAEQRSQMMGMLDAWWKTARSDVVNVVREAKSARVKGV